jgi:hypothetical protein
MRTSSGGRGAYRTRVTKGDDEAAMQNRSKEELDRVLGAFMAYTEAVKSA